VFPRALAARERGERETSEQERILPDSLAFNAKDEVEGRDRARVTFFFLFFGFSKKQEREGKRRERSLALRLSRFLRHAHARERERERALTRSSALTMLASPSGAIEAAVDALAEELAFPFSASSTSSASATAFVSSPPPSAAPSAKLRAAAVSVLSRGGGGVGGGAPSAPGRWRKVNEQRVDASVSTSPMPLLSVSLFFALQPSPRLLPPVDWRLGREGSLCLAPRT